MTVPLFLSPAHNKLVSAFVIARLVSARRLAPRSHRVTSTGGFTFTAAMWMVHRVHGHTAVHRLLAQPDIASGLADGNVFVFHVADLAHSCHAVNQHFAGLTGRQLYQRVLAFLGDQLCSAAGRAHHLCTFAWLQFNVVNGSTGGNVLKRKRVADEDIGFWTADDLLANLQSNGLNDVALLTISVSQQCDAGGAVGIVFSGYDR